MKFGIALPNFGKYANRDALVGIAKTAEDLGLDSIWVSDHIVIPESHRGGFGDVFYEPLITLSYLAACTNRISLGTSVIILPYRNPVVLGKMLSTLDVLSEGRVILGVGVGWVKDEFDALGISYEERGAVSDECIEVLNVIWTEEKPSFKGKYYNLSGIKFLPKPIQKPMPIWVGGNSKIAVRRAVDLGDGWHPVGLMPEEIKEKAEYASRLLDERKRTSEFIISLRKNLQIKDASKKEIKIDNREIMSGTPDEIIKSIERYRESGVSHIVFQVLSRTLEGVVRTMEVFSKEIRSVIS